MPNTVHAPTIFSRAARDVGEISDGALRMLTLENNRGYFPATKVAKELIRRIVRSHGKPVSYSVIYGIDTELNGDSPEATAEKAKLSSTVAHIISVVFRHPRTENSEDVSVAVTLESFDQTGDTILTLSLAPSHSK